MPKSFSDPDTHFHLIRGSAGRPVAENGSRRRNQWTGEIRCCECGSVGENIDEIPHRPECSQRWVRSRFWQHEFEQR